LLAETLPASTACRSSVRADWSPLAPGEAGWEAGDVTLGGMLRRGGFVQLETGEAELGRTAGAESRPDSDDRRELGVDMAQTEGRKGWARDWDREREEACSERSPCVEVSRRRRGPGGSGFAPPSRLLAGRMGSSAQQLS
jgi:hypothetical protein